jgi:hypothetical protein
MIKNKAIDDFWKLFNKLDEGKKEAVKKAFKQFKENPKHSSLQFLKLSSGYYSIRTKLDYRVVGCKKKENNDVIYIWLWIGTKEEFKSFIKTLKYRTF